MANVNNTGYTYVFACVACVLASVLLAGTSQVLKPLQNKNIKIDKQRSVLIAAGFGDKNTPTEEVNEWFQGDIVTKVIKLETGEADESIPTDAKKIPETHSLVYECVKKGQECSIIPVVGKGLWGKMYGYIAIGPDNNSILGLCFYKHQETPGLGAEITEPWFMDNFKAGKKLLKKEGDFSKESFVGVKVLKGIKATDKPENEQPYYVDGISGATITSDGVTDITAKFLYERFAKYLSNRNEAAL